MGGKLLKAVGNEKQIKLSGVQQLISYQMATMPDKGLNKITFNVQAQLILVNTGYFTVTKTKHGQYRAHLIIIPFSTEKESVGKPQIFQSRILTGSPNVPVTEKSFEQGIPVFSHFVFHLLTCSW